MNLLDEVFTEEGGALVVGFPTHDQVEVRLQESGGLRVLYREDVKPVEKTEIPAEAMALARTTPIEVPVDEDGNPVSPRTGRKLSGIARSHALAKLGRDQ